MKLMNIGFGNFINAEKVTAILMPDSSPVKRLLKEAKENGTCIDATQGRQTKSILITEDDKIFLSYLTPEAFSERQ